MNDALNAPASVLKRVELIAGRRPIRFTESTRGYTSAVRGIVDFSEGLSLFVKAGVDEQTARWLRDEQCVYAGINAAFMPAMLGWSDGPSPVLLLEDLSGAAWPPPWTERMVAQVVAMLAQVRTTAPPVGLPSLESMRPELASWSHVAADPESFLKLSVCSPAWLEKALPTLLAAEKAAVLAGDDLIHFDVRSSNLCFSGGRVLLIDWNWACVGNGAMELVHWLPNLHVDGGPVPQGIMDANPELVAVMTGYWAHRARLSEPLPGSSLRKVQLAQLKAILPWCAHALSLESPAQT